MRILCVACREPLYAFDVGRVTHGAAVDFTAFRPLRPEVPAPSPGRPAQCPFCARPFYMTLTRGGVILLTSQGFFPRPPSGKKGPRTMFVPRPRKQENPDFV